MFYNSFHVFLSVFASVSDAYFKGFIRLRAPLDTSAPEQVRENKQDKLMDEQMQYANISVLIQRHLD
jgi:hypothetical protein